MGEYRSSAGFESAALTELIAFVSAHGENASLSFEEFEQVLHEKTCALEREQLGIRLASHDENASHVKVDGRRYRRKGSNEAPYLTQAGEVRVARALYVPCGGGGRAICPMELKAGIVGGYWSPRAAKIAMTAVAQMTPRECSSLFSEQGGMQPSASSLDRLPKVCGERWERRRVEFEVELRAEETASDLAVTLVIWMDGVHAPMKSEGRAEKRCQEDKRPMGPAGFKEVGCATVSLLDAEGERLETIRYARMPQQGKLDVKAWVMAEASSIVESMPGLEVVFVADGAPDLWQFANELKRHLGIEDMHKVVDAFHVLERVKRALDAYHGDGSAKSRGAFEELRQRLCEEPDGVAAVLRALRYRRNRSRGAARKIIETQVRYLEKHQDRMGYAALRERDLPIGSGIVEAACKTLVTQRLKRSGMSWSIKGGQGILTVRSLLQSGRWQRAWSRLASEFIKPVVPAA